MIAQFVIAPGCERNVLLGEDAVFALITGELDGEARGFIADRDGRVVDHGQAPVESALRWHHVEIAVGDDLIFFGIEGREGDETFFAEGVPDVDRGSRVRDHDAFTILEKRAEVFGRGRVSDLMIKRREGLKPERCNKEEKVVAADVAPCGKDAFDLARVVRHAPTELVGGCEVVVAHLKRALGPEPEVGGILLAEVEVHEGPAGDEHAIDGGGVEVEFFSLHAVVVGFGADSEVDPVFGVERTEARGGLAIGIIVVVFAFEVFGEEFVIFGVAGFDADGASERFGGVGAVIGVGHGEPDGGVDGGGDQGENGEAGEALSERAEVKSGARYIIN